MAINFFKADKPILESNITYMKDGDLAVALDDKRWYIKQDNTLIALDGTEHLTTDNFVDGSITEEKLAEAVRQHHVFNFDCVDTMVNSGSSLVDGCFCHTAGYYTAGDGGDAWYIVDRTGTNQDDLTTIYVGGIGLYAHFIRTNDEINVKQLGAHCNGQDSDDRYFQYAVANFTRVKSTGVALLEQTLKIRASQLIDFAEIASAASTYAIQITSGSGGRIHIKKISNAPETQGGGIAIITEGNSNVTDLIEACSINIDRMDVQGTCLNFANAAGVLDTKFSGIFWKTNGAVPAINTDNITAYVGQLDFNVNRIISLGDYAIKLNSTGAPLTGFNFGYCSLESSLKGIYINANSHNIEPIRGMFRVIEFADTDKILTLAGHAQYFASTGASEITFDRYCPQQIDLSNFTIPAYYNNYDIFIINGVLTAGEANKDRFILANKVYIKPTGLQFEPTVSGQMDLLDSSNFTGFDETGNIRWKTNKTTANRYLNVDSAADAVHIPTWWKGDELYLEINNVSGTTINANYEKNSFVEPLLLTKGKHSIIMTYDQNGIGFLREAANGGGSQSSGEVIVQGDVADRLLYSNPIKASTGFNSAGIIVGSFNGYQKVAGGVEFNIYYPILYATEGLNTNEIGNNQTKIAYKVIADINFGTSGTIQKDSTNIDNKVVWLKGTLNGSIFTCASSSWLTTVIPDEEAEGEVDASLGTEDSSVSTIDNNFYYIPLGVISTGTSGQFSSSNQIWTYRNGAFQPIELTIKTIAGNLQNINNLIQVDTTNGLQVKNSSNEFERVSTAKHLIIPSDSTQITGVLPVDRGGTGKTYLTAGSALIGGGESNTITLRAITNIASAGTVTANDNLITANTLVNYIGSTNQTTVGIITSGTWNGDAIPVTRGGTGASGALNATGNALKTIQATARNNLGITPDNIGAADKNHNHDNTYLKLAGGTMTGSISGLKVKIGSTEYSLTATHRMYNKNNGYHMYSWKDSEVADLKKAGWTDEGTCYVFV